MILFFFFHSIFRKVDGNLTGIQIILQFVGQVLNSEIDHHASKIGFLIYKIISLFSDQLGTTVADILKAVLSKLEQIKVPSMLQVYFHFLSFFFFFFKTF